MICMVGIRKKMVVEYTMMIEQGGMLGLGIPRDRSVALINDGVGVVSLGVQAHVCVKVHTMSLKQQGLRL